MNSENNTDAERAAAIEQANEEARKRYEEWSAIEEERTEKFSATLDRPPLRIFDVTKPAELVPEMEERLAAVLWRYQCTPTPDGWRDLAIKLLLEHEPAFKVETPVDGIPGDDGSQWWWILQLNQLAERVGKAQAAREVAKLPDAPSAGRLRNLFSEIERGEVKPPRSFRRLGYVMKAEEALRRAMQRVESK
jgi:hypothetical protein